LFVFPNPTSDVLKLNITQFTPNNLKCEIYNSNGQIVKNIEHLEFQNSINTSDLANGVYIVKVFNSEVSAIKKVAISK